MASMRDIKLKIKSVKNTQQITKAMNLVSAAKLQRAKAKLETNRPFYKATRGVLGSLVESCGNVSHRYLTARSEVKNFTTIVIAADRGLCGGYNVNICKKAREFNKDKTGHNYLAVGSRARDFFRRRKSDVLETYAGISEDPMYEDALKIGEKALELFKKGETDEVWLAYTEFKSIISHQPKMIRLLPVDTAEIASEHGAGGENGKSVEQGGKGGEQGAEESKGNEGAAKALMRFEPDEDAVLDYLVPKYVNTVIYGALLESAACQEGARMTAMDSATDNAQEMIEKYTVSYNRARQGAITQELTEIVSGANALE